MQITQLILVITMEVPLLLSGFDQACWSILKPKPGLKLEFSSERQHLILPQKLWFTFFSVTGILHFPVLVASHLVCEMLNFPNTLYKEHVVIRICNANCFCLDKEVFLKSDDLEKTIPVLTLVTKQKVEAASIRVFISLQERKKKPF